MSTGVRKEDSWLDELVPFGTASPNVKLERNSETRASPADELVEEIELMMGCSGKCRAYSISALLRRARTKQTHPRC